MISIKNSSEIALMQQAGKIVALCHQEIAKVIAPGVTTKELDGIVSEIISDNGAIPSFLNYGGFPATICASPNEHVIHGFPDERPLENGDIISIDIGANYRGYHGDSAWTYPVGEIETEDQRLLTETENALWSGLEQVRDGKYLSDVSHAIELHAKKHELGVVRDFAGHGIGKQLHESPEILNYGLPGRGPKLKLGMTLAIEPMLNLGTARVKILADGWTVKTKDGANSAHFEHTILVTKDGYEVLTTL